MAVSNSDFAEDSNYFETTIHPAKSWAEIEETLEEFGVSEIMTAKGRMDGRPARMIRFNWRGNSYRFEFVARKCRQPDKVTSFSGKRRSHRDQAEYQMGREAVNFVKAMLIAAKSQPVALFGFLELPGVSQRPGGLPVTAGQLDTSELVATLPPLLPSDIDIVDME